MRLVKLKQKKIDFFPGTPVNFCNHLKANSPSFKSIETIQFDNATARHWNKERIFTHELLLMNLRVWVLSFEFEKQSDIWQMRNTGSLINSVCNSLHLLTLHFWGTVARPRMDSKRGKWKKIPCLALTLKDEFLLTKSRRNCVNEADFVFNHFPNRGPFSLETGKIFGNDHRHLCGEVI